MSPSSDSNHFSLEAGQALRHGGIVILIVEKLGEHCILENLASGERKTVWITRLLQDYREGNLIPCSAEEANTALQPGFDPDAPLVRELNLPLSDLSPATIQDGLKKIRYIRALRALGYTSLRPTYPLELDYKKLVQQQNDLTAPKLSTLYTCSRRIEASHGDLRAAFPNYKDRGGKGQHRWHKEADAAFIKLVERLNQDTNAQIRPTLAQKSLQTILLEQVDLPQLFSIMPSLSSIERRLHEAFGEYEIYKRKHGKAEADKVFRHWYPRDSAVMPLEVIEFDDKDSRCFLWDRETTLPCGRAYITTGVDQYSAVPMGFDISDRHRNVLSAKRAYLDAILPWDSSDPSYRDIKSSPEFYGRFGIAVFDNALYNHATDLELLVLEISRSTIVAWAKPRTPTEKSVIEDFNGRMVADCFEKLPGYGGPKNSISLLSSGQESCCMTAQDFRKALLHWAYDIYCNTPREGYTPRERWRMGMQNITPRLPKILDAALLASTLLKRRRLRPEGVQLAKGLSYQSQELLLLQRHLGHNAEVNFRYNPNHLAQIYVEDPRTSKYLVVPSTTPDYTRHLSLYQHHLVLKHSAERGRKHPSLPDLLNGLEALQRMVEQLRFSKKKREREVARKSTPDPVGNTEELGRKSIPLQPKTVEVMSALEASVLDLEDVELEDDEEKWSFPL